MGSLDDRSGFHNLSLRPESWPLSGVDAGTGYVCTTIPFGYESPVCYRSPSEAKAAYLRPRGIPVLAYIDDAWYGNFPPRSGASTRHNGCPPRRPFTWKCRSRIFAAAFCRTPSAT